MYGYEIPSYVREYLREWRRYDRFLRCRWSLDEPGKYILERKTRYLLDHPFSYGTDKQVQYKDEYRKIFVFQPRDIRFVKRSLELTDIQRYGGAKALADQLDAYDEHVWDMADRAQHSEFEALASEHYDRLAWAEGRRVVRA